ncbi:MAG: response regulator transcription factor [Saprospiraceae bacterium]|nr:LytTR family DNA-binding domain-containing protein [Bacteroidia bacterium]MBT8230853.1 LytTR family DNA-binding domain-containing protein [Bacteroidia bacterium]NNF21820.1 response regulator transcription factor [Saprospiraceae bacterium]NNK90248.1 response regulator transcription factor [Saprospiraceae bacterium]
MLKSIIVDDDLMARQSIKTLCDKNPDIQCEKIFADAIEAIDFLGKSPVDLIFLDIEMPEMSGLEMLEKLPTIPQVIFITSNKEYAFEAYEYDVTDFLKKPVLMPRFNKAISKAVERQEKLIEISDSSAASEVYVKSDGKLVRLSYESILYFENVGDYVKVITENGNHIIHGTLKGIDSRLRHPRFIKIHRSFIINLEHVIDIEDNSVLIEKKVIPISRAHRSILMERLNIL